MARVSDCALGTAAYHCEVGERLLDGELAYLVARERARAARAVRHRLAVVPVLAESHKRTEARRELVKQSGARRKLLDRPFVSRVEEDGRGRNA